MAESAAGDSHDGGLKVMIDLLSALSSIINQENPMRNLRPRDLGLQRRSHHEDRAEAQLH